MKWAFYEDLTRAMRCVWEVGADSFKAAREKDAMRRFHGHYPDSTVDRTIKGRELYRVVDENGKAFSAAEAREQGDAALGYLRAVGQYRTDEEEGRP
jgi:hypothetical protein